MNISRNEEKPAVIVIGGGGHSTVVIDILRLQTVPILGILDNDETKHGSHINGVTILGSDSILTAYSKEEVVLVNALGSVGPSNSYAARRSCFERLVEKGYRFAKIIHPSAVIASTVLLKQGVQLLAGSIVQANSQLGENTIVNTKASIDHECILAAHVHVAPGATICGNVVIGEGTHVGAGATVLQGVTIGQRCLIAAGAVVISDVKDDSIVMGVPARIK